MAAPTVYRVKEYELAQVPLRDLLGPSGELRLNPDVESKDYFTIQASKGRLCLRARGHVGLIPLNERVSIEVEPRTPAGNLLHLLSVARRPADALAEERGYEKDRQWSGSLLGVYARALISRLEEIASQGLLREYERRTEVTSFPRGRILTTPTVRQLHSRGLTHKVVAARFEHSSDNAANRCLKYALWFLGGLLREEASLGLQKRRLLDRAAPLYEVLGEVKLDHSLGFLRDSLVLGTAKLPSLRSYYRPAIDLATAIVQLHGVQLESRAGAVRLPSMVLDMSDLFERYLRNTLAAQARGRGWRHRVLDGNAEGKTLLFDEKPSPPATPDIVVRDLDKEGFPLLIEVKSAPVKSFHSERSAIEQALTYGLSYRCNQVVLAHPRQSSESFQGLRLQGRIGDLSLYQYVFDLAADPIEQEEERFAAAMEQIVSGTAVDTPQA
jgi:5-methylcytosine-specific restriction enzyme subunit McrC